MATAYLRRGSSHFERTERSQERHIPVKRIAPCPPSEHIVAQAKRSRMTMTPSGPSKPPALAIRNAKQNFENETSASAIAWNSSNGFQGQSNVFAPTTLVATPWKGLQYDPVNSGNVTRMSMSRITSGANEPKKSRCCPLLMSSTGFSTPPYRMSSAAQRGKEDKRSRKRPLSQRLKRRSAESKKVKAGNCFDAMTDTVVRKVRPVRDCVPQKAAPQPQMNALSVYHSFLRQREAELTSEKSSELPTTTTTLGSCIPTSRTKSCVKEKTPPRYSSNFAPQMTSTPQKRRSPTVEVHPAVSSEFKVPIAPSPHGNNDDDGTLDHVLEALEEERKMGSSHIMLPLEELTYMVRGMQQKQKRDEDRSNSTCSGSTGTTASNNNNDDFKTKGKPVVSKPKLPGIYPIGAPRAASSPIPIPKKRDNAISNDIMLIGGDSWKFYPIGNDESVFSVGMTAGATDVWRPW